MDDVDQQPARRERIGGHAWVRTLGLVAGGTLSDGATARRRDGTTTDEDATTGGASSSDPAVQAPAREHRMSRGPPHAPRVGRATPGQAGRRTATRKSDSGPKGRRSQVDSSRSGAQPADRASARKSSNS